MKPQRITSAVLPQTRSVKFMRWIGESMKLLLAVPEVLLLALVIMEGGLIA
jgi:hypothetical protein